MSLLVGLQVERVQGFGAEGFNEFPKARVPYGTPVF